MQIIVRDLSQQLNDRAWEVYLPNDIVNVVPEYYKKFPGVAPIFKGDGSKAKGVATITQMVNYAIDGVQFSIRHPEDVVQIYKFVCDYIEEVHDVLPNLPKTESLSTYVKKLKYFKTLLEDYAKDCQIILDKKRGFRRITSLHQIFAQLSLGGQDK